MDSFYSLVTNVVTAFMESQERPTPEEQMVVFEKVRAIVIDGMNILPELSGETKKVCTTSRQANMKARL